MSGTKNAASPTASLRFEHQCWNAGYRYVVGLDEAGRGTLAGPVSAGAVCLPSEHDTLMQALQGVRDSKQMTPRQRDRLSERIREVALGWGVGSASSQEIDEIGIVPATKLAMRRALDMLVTTANLRPDYLLLDSIKWEEAGIRQDHIVKGDMLCLSIAAASVLAKVWRDQHMRELDARFPQYGFAHHKGYGTPKHLDALREFGPSSIHRMTFAPMRLSANNTVTSA